MIRALAAAALALLAFAAPAAAQPAGYFDNSGRSDVLTGGVRMIPITTSKGTFRVWTKRVGNNPRLKVLLLHGGPAVPHDYLEAFDSFLPREGVEYYYYDQLGAGNSDRPEDMSLWNLPRFVEEVEQVRVALGLTRDNFCLYGQSWGGLLAIEYALKYQANLKCMIVSNMMASVPAYNDYAQKVLMPAMDPKQLAEVKALEAAGKTEDPRYMALLVPMHYEQHILRMPFDQWPEPAVRAFTKVNQPVYAYMQGPSELGAGGILKDWDRFEDLAKIQTPTLVMAARYDTMDPAYMEKMARKLPHGSYAFMPNGSHLALYDDQANYFAALTGFLKKFD
ncbi:proline iminopeptidase-family hydrolase [Sphingomonas sp.]|uniref:proline iminopeptidase-family hydrolase n=1 Tax=Sphingomonas sp. TaxID=28214 RepID=UPI001B1FE49A|nr:proline iminopeptidase-family hydrolase [Sphingomonas sp.]MBO9711805.1 proline iminopeptidase-family hydrolase [Sphingomonas sp.]